MEPKHVWLVYWIGRGLQAVGSAMLLYQIVGVSWDAVIVGLALVVAGGMMVGGSGAE